VCCCCLSYLATTLSYELMRGYEQVRGVLW
jgi:hypothetical protein